MNYEWEPILQYSIDQMGYLLYMARRTPTGREFLTATGKVLVAKQGTMVKQPMWLARFDDTAQLKKLITEAEKMGVKSPSTDRVEGELTATKEHLADMRRLVFEPPTEVERRIEVPKP